MAPEQVTAYGVALIGVLTAVGTVVWNLFLKFDERSGQKSLAILKQHEEWQTVLKTELDACKKEIARLTRENIHCHKINYKLTARVEILENTLRHENIPFQEHKIGDTDIHDALREGKDKH